LSLIGSWVLACALVPGASAKAAASPRAGVGATALEQALAAAASYWHNTPCQGDVTMLWQSVAPPSPVAGTTTEAWVSFQTPLGPQDFSAPPSTYTECEVHISLKRWPSLAALGAEDAAFCQMIVHEFGHLEGFADSFAYSPTDVRYPILTAANVPGVCRGAADTGIVAGTTPKLKGFEREARPPRRAAAGRLRRGR
jgi:hypothetical protein